MINNRTLKITDINKTVRTVLILGLTTIAPPYEARNRLDWSAVHRPPVFTSSSSCYARG